MRSFTHCPLLMSCLSQVERTDPHWVWSDDVTCSLCLFLRLRLCWRFTWRVLYRRRITVARHRLQIPRVRKHLHQTASRLFQAIRTFFQDLGNHKWTVVASGQFTTFPCVMPEIVAIDSVANAECRWPSFDVIMALLGFLCCTDVVVSCTAHAVRALTNDFHTRHNTLGEVFVAAVPLYL